MSLIYPLNAVITSDEALAAEYDQHALSAFLTSGALRPDAFSSLVSQGARFEAIVTVNGEYAVEVKKWTKNMARGLNVKTKVLNVDIPERLVLTEAVKKIHLAFNPSAYGMTAAGG
jgi:hypothetical protein